MNALDNEIFTVLFYHHIGGTNHNAVRTQAAEGA
jgi:hypothetical protein